jgi:hypothetical protein
MYLTKKHVLACAFSPKKHSVAGAVGFAEFELFQHKSGFKGTVRRKLMWVKSGVNR